MKVLIVVAVLASACASSFPELGMKCNIAEGVFWRTAAIHNPNTYLYCNNRVTALGTCPSGTGFLKTGDEACTSFTSWKCLNFSLIMICENSQPDYMRPLANPNLFSFCEGDKVSVASCPTNYGFASGPKSSGCMPWSVWNGVTNCFES